MKNLIEKLIEFARKFPILKLFPVKFYRFVIVGLTVFAIDLAIFSFLFHVLKFQSTINLFQLFENFDIVFSLPNIVSVSLASIFGYIINKNWSFEDNSDNVSSQFGKYLAVAIFNNVINQIVFGVFFYGVFANSPMAETIKSLICKVIATSFQTVTSFVAYKYFVFTEDKEVISETTV
jgi:putative flippase GtrA